MSKVLIANVKGPKGDKGDAGDASPEMIAAAEARAEEVANTTLPGMVEDALTAAGIPAQVAAQVAAQVTPAVLDAGRTAALEALADDPDVVAQAAALAQQDAGLVRSNDIRLAQPVTDDDKVVRAFVDNLSRILLAFLTDGSVSVPSLVSMFADVDTLTADSINGVTYDSSVASITGYTRVWVDQANRVLIGLRTDGTWHIPLLETNVNLEAAAPRTYRASNSTVERQIVSGPNIALAGHSMLAGASGAISTAFSGLASVTSLSVGGETSRTIAARQGGQPMTILPVGGEFPASGGVDLVLAYADGPIPTATNSSGWPLLQGATSYAGYVVLLDGTKLAGTFSVIRDAAAEQYRHHVGDRYRFTRSSNGSAVPAARPVAFYFDVAVPRWDDVFVYWVARNNISETDQAIGDLQSMIQRQGGLEKRFLVLSEHNSSTEVAGTSGWNSVAAYNARARALFGRRFIDTRQYLIDWGLADAGITPTAPDTADIANGVVPTSLRSDGLHLNAAGNAVIAQLVRRRTLELWAAEYVLAA